MTLSALDWIVLAVYFVVSGAIGLAYAKKASGGADDFFTAGRSLPWWLAGTSMVATTFAADTPLAVAGLVHDHGVAGNWLWWSMAFGNLLTTFFFARLWHRAKVRTDAELAELRYSGKPAAFLRGFRATYLAVPINLIVMGWVNLAMVKILGATFDLDPFTSMLVLFALTVVYSAASGLWGVVTTDAFQFVLAMIGCIALAVIAVGKVGGLDVLLEKVSVRFGSREAAVSPLPGGWLPVSVFLSMLTVQWWASWYPGSEPGGGGYVAQRIFATKSERDGVLATLWFTVAHYAVRPWPWILVALAAMVLYPEMNDPAQSWLRTAVELLPTGLKGLFLAAFAAAYMSTMSTQLNWGTSYLASDLYARFVNPQATQAQIVRFSRGCTAVLFVLSAGATWLLAKVGTVDAAWRILIALGAGTGAVYLLRWFWWRVNAWSEVSAMVGSIVSFFVLTGVFGLDPGDLAQGTWLMMANTGITTVIWVTVTMLTKPTDDAVLDAFWKKLTPGGPGWKPVAARTGVPSPPLGWRNFVCWGAGVVCVYSALFGTGDLLLGSFARGVGLLVLAAASFAVIAVTFKERGA